MPRYDYDCADCGRRFEVVHGVYGDSPTSCPLCGGGPVRKAIAAPTVHFKGSGWAKKERRAPVSSDSSSKVGAEEGGAKGSTGDGPNADGGSPSTPPESAGRSSTKDGPSTTTPSTTPAAAAPTPATSD